MKRVRLFYPLSLAALSVAVFGFFVSGCIDPIPAASDEDVFSPVPPPLEEVAQLLSSLQMDVPHLEEVHDAVSSSSGNGYDEEYTMSDLFTVPGSGVGDDLLPSKSASVYQNPLSELIRDYLYSSVAATKSSDGVADVSDDEFVQNYINSLMSSDIQIYWPFSSEWDGKTMPVITFDPEDDTSVNVGYRTSVGENGEIVVDTVIVDEAFASENPVWVVNRNNDDKYLSLEMLRNLGPGTIVGGGEVVVMPGKAKVSPAAWTTSLRTLLIKDFTMKRNYDSWFAGASEFFVKCGAVEDFTASTEAELQLYSPSVTDFMIVVKRKQVGLPQPFNAVLVSDWTDQLDNCAFMIVEDDGGTTTSWKCNAIVRIASKGYGIEIDLPFRTRDDVVWRGALSSRYFEENNNVTGHFGDVDITFEIVNTSGV